MKKPDITNYFTHKPSGQYVFEQNRYIQDFKLYAKTLEDKISDLENRQSNLQHYGHPILFDWMLLCTENKDKDGFEASLKSFRRKYSYTEDSADPDVFCSFLIKEYHGGEDQ